MDNHGLDDNALEVVKIEAIDWQDWARQQHIMTIPDAIGE
jgi:hypothetical protein